ncbi:MAG: hypothetical protein ACXWBP_08450 [Limisphaerales bacterium]
MKRWFLFSAVAALTVFSRSAFADTTALDLIAEGNRYVGEQSKDKVVEIFSENSIASLTPKIWTIVFFDPTATFKSVQVRFEAGKMKDVKRPFRVLQMGTGEHKTLDMTKVKIDSDKALSIAKKQPILEGLELRGSQLWLATGNSRVSDLYTGPVWKVKLFAAKASNKNATADIGDIYIAADDGKVIKDDFHINSAE